MGESGRWSSDTGLRGHDSEPPFFSPSVTMRDEDFAQFSLVSRDERQRKMHSNPLPFQSCTHRMSIAPEGQYSTAFVKCEGSPIHIPRRKCLGKSPNGTGSANVVGGFLDVDRDAGNT